MKIAPLLFIAFIALVCIATPTRVDAQNPAICPNLTGEARTQCLREEARRHQSDADYWTAYTRSLERDMNAACDAARALDRAARTLSRTPNAAVNAAGRTWRSARAAADAALRQQGECDRLRRETRRR